MVKDGAIIWFRGEHYWLSNFYHCRIMFKGIAYPNAEAAFQAQKVDILSSFRPDQFTEKDKERFTALDGLAAKKLGMGRSDRQFRMNDEELKAWHPIALSVMEDIVRAKFNQNPELKEKLLETEDLRLIEGNNWNDDFYGISLLLECPDDPNPWKRKKLKRDEDGSFILAHPETEDNNHLGKILMKIREELREAE